MVVWVSNLLEAKGGEESVDVGVDLCIAQGQPSQDSRRIVTVV